MPVIGGPVRSWNGHLLGAEGSPAWHGGAVWSIASALPSGHRHAGARPVPVPVHRSEERTTPMAFTALLALDLAGTFAFALNGALTALRATRLDLVGVVTLGMITALGGGTIRDILLDSLPPAPSSTGGTWRWQRWVG